MTYDPIKDRQYQSDVFGDSYRTRYAEDFVDRPTPRDLALVREAIEAEEKIQEKVRQLSQRLRLK